MAFEQLKEIWRKEPTQGSANFILTHQKTLREEIPLIRRRVAFLCSFTLEPAIPLFRTAAFLRGIDLEVQVGGFNAYAQELLDPMSAVYEFDPHVVITAVQTRDVAPELWDGVSAPSQDTVADVVERVVALYRSMVTAFRKNSQASLIIHGLDVPPRARQGYLDKQYFGQVDAITRINHELNHMAQTTPGVYILDYDSLVARHGRLHWYDEQKWLTMRMPIAAPRLIHLANEWLRYVCPLVGKIGKVLVTDLDNTLWGGIIGEDGIDKIQLGHAYPGPAFKALQQVMRDLSQRGIILAVCSKNNWDDAMEVFEKHPDMLLRREHFAAFRINWADKAQNLREIAHELNVGIDSLVFLDDNPVEREQIRQFLPEVTIVDLPADPLGYAAALQEVPEFERLSISDEDRERNRYYAAQRERKELEQTVGAVEDYYRSLDQEVDIIPVTPQNLPRVAQLTQKTNQFNLTTKRYSEADIRAFGQEPGHRMFAVRVKDRFGDNGIVGVVLTVEEEHVCEIDTFLLSCRVISRTVETAMLSFLVDECRTKDIAVLEGWYRQTAKNAPCKDMYAQHGFQDVEKDGDSMKWSLRVEAGSVVCPPSIRLTTSA